MKTFFFQAKILRLNEIKLSNLIYYEIKNCFKDVKNIKK